MPNLVTPKCILSRKTKHPRGRRQRWQFISTQYFTAFCCHRLLQTGTNQSSSHPWTFWNPFFCINEPLTNGYRNKKQQQLSVIYKQSNRVPDWLAVLTVTHVAFAVNSLWIANANARVPWPNLRYFSFTQNFLTSTDEPAARRGIADMHSHTACSQGSFSIYVKSKCGSITTTYTHTYR